ncbi:MAG: hypothetical protein HQK87_04350 [Nitrospinae bacterium]|nr:hypothetical protein [Nitrospinota bacterium]
MTHAGRFALAVSLALLLVSPPAFAESYRLLSGAPICKSKEGMTRWLDAIDGNDEPARAKLLETGECLFNFRKQLVEAVELRMFYKVVTIRIDGRLWYVSKENIRVPAPEPGEEER